VGGAPAQAQAPKLGWNFSNDTLDAFHSNGPAPLGRVSRMAYNTSVGTQATHSVMFAQVAVITPHGHAGPSGTPEVAIPLRINGKAKSHVRAIFRLLRANFPPNSAEKIAEISRFDGQKGESVRSLYARFQSLRKDTGFLLIL
jgi:hypothetical protein